MLDGRRAMATMGRIKHVCYHTAVLKKNVHAVTAFFFPLLASAAFGIAPPTLERCRSFYRAALLPS